MLTDADRLRWCYDGQKVIAPFGSEGIRCVVIKACGNHALVANEELNFEKWFDVLDLFPDKSQP
jgi:hypothetical protein